MKTNTITPRTETILRLADNLQAIDGSLMQSQAFYDFLRFQRDIQQRIDNTWEQIENFMRSNDIPTVKGDWGHMTLATKVNLKADTAVLTDPMFFKQQLDTAKLKAHQKMFGTFPEGVTSTTTEYLSKKVNPKW